MPNYSHATRLTLASAEEPPYLAVGTDVSAKYKGAFCEAKIIDVNKHVKLRVLFDGSSGSYLIDDSDLKSGSVLETGTKIEAKHPEKKQQTFVQATITKILDHSRYTVVFDDGDQCVLRRNSLCLKSGKHFAESETLDQLPLTNPEHFGNPVKVGAIEHQQGNQQQAQQQQHNNNNNQNNQNSSKSSSNSSSYTSNKETVSNKDTQSGQHSSSGEAKPRGRAAASGSTSATTPASVKRGGPKGRKRRESVNNGSKQVPNLDEDSADSNTNTIDAGTSDSSVRFDLIEVGVKLMVQYGKGKVQNVYEAKVNKIEVNSAGKTQYFVHYTGWNNRYDEWITKNRVLSIVTDKENGSIVTPAKEAKEKSAPPTKTRRTTKSQSKDQKETGSKTQAEVSGAHTNDEETKKSGGAPKNHVNASNAGSTDDSSLDNEPSSVASSKGYSKRLNETSIPEDTQSIANHKASKSSTSNVNDQADIAHSRPVSSFNSSSATNKNSDQQSKVTSGNASSGSNSSTSSQTNSSTAATTSKQISSTRTSKSNSTYSPPKTTASIIVTPTREAKEKHAPPTKTRRTTKSQSREQRETGSKMQSDATIQQSNDDETKRSGGLPKGNLNASSAGSTDDSSQDNEPSLVASSRGSSKKPSENVTGVLAEEIQLAATHRAAKVHPSNVNDSTNAAPSRPAASNSASSSASSKSSDQNTKVTSSTANSESNSPPTSHSTSSNTATTNKQVSLTRTSKSNLTYSPSKTATSVIVTPTREAKEKHAPPTKTRRTTKSQSKDLKETGSKTQTEAITTEPNDEESKKSGGHSKSNLSATACSTDDSSLDNEPLSAAVPKGPKKLNENVLPEDNQMTATHKATKTCFSVNDSSDIAHSRLTASSSVSSTATLKGSDNQTKVTSATTNSGSNSTAPSNSTSSNAATANKQVATTRMCKSNLTYSPPASTLSPSSSTPSSTSTTTIATGLATPATTQSTAPSTTSNPSSNEVFHREAKGAYSNAKVIKEEKMISEPTPAETLESINNNSHTPPSESKTIYSFCDEIDESDCDKKISIIQERIMALRQTYMSLKSELNDLDRRRKRPRTDRSNSEHINCGLMCRN